MANSRFGLGPDRRIYLAVAPDSIHGVNPVSIFERKSDSEYKLRTVIRYEARGQGKSKQPVTTVWSDENDDAIEQPNEVHEYPLPTDYSGWITGWYMPMTPDLTFYGSQYELKVAGWTACGAPRYDFSKMTRLPAPANLASLGGMGAQKSHGSADHRLVLYNGPTRSTTRHSTASISHPANCSGNTLTRLRACTARIARPGRPMA